MRDRESQEVLRKAMMAAGYEFRRALRSLSSRGLDIDLFDRLKSLLFKRFDELGVITHVVLFSRADEVAVRRGRLMVCSPHGLFVVQDREVAAWRNGSRAGIEVTFEDGPWWDEVERLLPELQRQAVAVTAEMQDALARAHAEMTRRRGNARAQQLAQAERIYKTGK